MSDDDVQLRQQIENWALEQAVYREARLLDEEKLTEWLEMTTEDVVYRMAMTSRKFRKDRSAEQRFGPGYIFNDDRNRLGMRIQRLKSGYVWAEDPPNCVRRIVSNLEIVPAGQPDERTVYSVIIIHRSRIDGQTRFLVAGREDLWRNVGGPWRLARREMRLDHSTVPDTNLNVFF